MGPILQSHLWHRLGQCGPSWKWSWGKCYCHNTIRCWVRSYSIVIFWVLIIEFLAEKSQQFYQLEHQHPLLSLFPSLMSTVILWMWPDWVKRSTWWRPANKPVPPTWCSWTASPSQLIFSPDQLVSPSRSLITGKLDPSIINRYGIRRNIVKLNDGRLFCRCPTYPALVGPPVQDFAQNRLITKVRAFRLDGSYFVQIQCTVMICAGPQGCPAVN